MRVQDAIPAHDPAIDDAGKGRGMMGESSLFLGVRAFFTVSYVYSCSAQWQRGSHTVTQ